jgi:DNA-binding transcriptional MerR regulator
MDKSPDAFRTISEVAEDLDLPQHVLRFWETRFTQIKPMKRGGGRRYYRPQDVELIKGIRHMLYDQGYTIKGVQKLLKEGGGSREGHSPATARAPDPELSLDLDHLAHHDEPDADESGDDAADTGMDDGHDAARQVVVASPDGDQPAPSGMGAELRRDLEEILAELEQLRALLRPR